MKHLIIGTAGHVDHGKTSLVKALTGVDTDRLPEEKVRGMTIELGFTHLDLPSGMTLGFVDMPGHERFIKHMAAGAGGLDIALLVVAADEGIMRQTEEHLEILELLGVERAVVAITKSDLVDGEWLDMVGEEVRERLKGTALASSPIVAVSAASGSGIGELLSELDKLASLANERAAEPASRLYIDRVFTVTGHGTVVTGTLMGGPISQDDRLELLPSKAQVRVKQVEVHDRPVVRAERGQRAALNLTGVDKDQVARGMALATPGWLEPTLLIDAEVALARGAMPISHDERLRLHIGTSEVICRARVPKGQPDGKMYIQLEAEETMFPARGDRFILRTYSPQATIGGGKVLSVKPPRRRAGSEAEVASMRRLASESDMELGNELIRSVIRSECGSECIWPVEEGLLRRRAFMRDEEFGRTFGQADGDEGPVGLTYEGGAYYLDRAAYSDASSRIAELLSCYHGAFPLRRGMPREEARQKLMPKADRRQAAALFAELADDGRSMSSADLLWLPGHVVKLTDAQRRAAEALESAFRSELLTPPDLLDAISAAGPEASAVADYLAAEGILVKVSSDVAFHKDAVERALEAASGFEGPFTAAMLRDELGTSRKYAIALLEWMDSREYTQRSGDSRTLKAQYRRR